CVPGRQNPRGGTARGSQETQFAAKNEGLENFANEISDFFRSLFSRCGANELEADLPSQKATMSTNRPTVLILASDPAFSREITANWPQDPAPNSDSPEFILLDEGFSRDLEGSHYDLAIADASSVEERKHKDK